jgi:hypothetical protein
MRVSVDTIVVGFARAPGDRCQAFARLAGAISDEWEASLDD